VGAEFDRGRALFHGGHLKGYRALVTPNTLQPVVPDAIWVSERPLWFSGVRLWSRTTVVRLADGGLWVHSASAPTDEWCAALDALGPVRFLVVPNRYHHLHAPAAAARYPQAQVVGPQSIVARNPKVRVHLGAGDPEYLQQVPELAAIPLDGVPFLDETVFFHRASGSLIAADLLMSACARDHWTWRAAARVLGRYGKNLTPPDVRLKTRASAAAAQSIARISELPIERILVAHADPITEQPVECLKEAWQFVVPARRSGSA